MRFLGAFLLVTTTAIHNTNAFPVDGNSYYNSIALRDASPAIAHRCPNFAKTDPERYLGDLQAINCNWKLALICASLLLGCPAGCIAVVIELYVTLS